MEPVTYRRFRCFGVKACHSRRCASRSNEASISSGVFISAAALDRSRTARDCSRVKSYLLLLPDLYVVKFPRGALADRVDCQRLPVIGNLERRGLDMLSGL